MSYRFSGHQTFVFRHGWLEKGVDLVRNNARGFLSDNAIVELGVGKNMVESIKYWCLQTGLLEESKDPGEMKLTPFAEYIFGKEKDVGVDPYLEDDATLWLLHYNLAVRAPESALSIAINSLNKPEFTKAELLSFIQRYLSGKVSVSEKTLERDVDCFIHAYAGTRSKNIEDSFDCPLLALSLVQPTVDANLFRMNIGPKQNLPVELIGYAILNQMGEGSTSINLYNATYAAHSPGQVFKLTEDVVVDAVSELERKTDGRFSFSDTAGLNSIQIIQVANRAEYAMQLLDTYYGVKR